MVLYVGNINGLMNFIGELINEYGSATIQEILQCKGRVK